MTLLGAIAGGELIVILIVVLFMFLIPIIALVDIVRSKFSGNMQLIWVIIVLFFNIIGSLLYFIVGRHQKIQQ